MPSVVSWEDNTVTHIQRTQCPRRSGSDGGEGATDFSMFNSTVQFPFFEIVTESEVDCLKDSNEDIMKSLMTKSKRPWSQRMR